jgi:hypothetical protein
VRDATAIFPWRGRKRRFANDLQFWRLHLSIL